MKKRYIAPTVFAWLLLPFIIAVEWLVWGIHQGVEYVRPVNVRKRRRERPCAPPVPLPQRRHRLTFCLRDEPADRPVKTQAQSAFFKLPPELRNTIYGEVLVCPAPLHIWRTHKRLCSGPCGAQSVRQISRVAAHEQCRPPIARDGSVRRRPNGDAPSRDRIIPLLSSCRRIYSESIGLLYSQNTLIFDDWRALTLLPTVIPTHRLRSIRFVSLLLCALRGNNIDSDTRSSWPRVCEVLTAMASLEGLSIAIGSHTRNIYDSKHGKFSVLPLLTPLKEVQARRVRVQVPPGCLLGDWLGEEDQRFSLEIRQELEDSCNCCSFVPSGSSFPFPPSWDDAF
ncbi:hypothetical protein BJY01DRAFT_241672 [Aspergillus pseudoustus]|uniref:DUF7730 domain-containing protein n=1 Tax=Aspergillus pseudoustus TaxID=1810923 RepID=A0ABR4IA05_9EURO